MLNIMLVVFSTSCISKIGQYNINCLRAVLLDTEEIWKVVK